MEVIERIATACTPYVNFDPNSGRMLIQGRVIPQVAEEFWDPLLKWFYAYSSSPCEDTTLILNVEYFNTLSSKQILFLLHKVNELYEQGLNAQVIWQYGEGDEDMKEAGFDFSCVVNVPFRFEEIAGNVAI